LNDGLLDSATATVSVTVNLVNDALPIAVAIAATTYENEALALTLSASDYDDDALTYSVVTEPLHGELSGTGAARIYTPDSGFFGSDSFTYVANDGYGDSEVATVTITVVAVPEIEVVGDGNAYDLTGAEVTDFRSTDTLKTYDADGDHVYGSDGYFFYGNGTDASSNTDGTPSWVTSVETVSEVVVGDYTNFDNPTLDVEAVVADWTSTGICTVNNGSADMWSELLSFTVDETAPSSFRVGVLAGNEVTSDGRWDPAALRISCNGMVATATGLGTELGLVFFDITLPDGFDGTFTIEGQTRDVDTVKGPTMAGVVFDFDYELAFDTSSIGDVARANVVYTGSLVGSASDPDGDSVLTYSLLSGPEWLTVDSDGSLSGTPGSSSIGANTWTVQVSDDFGSTATSTLNIAVVDSVLIGYDFDSDAADWTEVTVVPSGVSASQFSSPMAISSSVSSDLSGLDALGLEFGSSSTTGAVGVQTVDAITTSFEAALAGDDYMSFTITPDEGVALDLYAVCFKVSLKSPDSVDEYVLTDAVGNQLGEPIVMTTDEAQGTFGAFNSVRVSLIGSALESITEATEFRIYAWGRGTSKTANTLALLDKLTLYGSVALGADYSDWAAGYGLSGDDAFSAADIENGGVGDGYSNLLEFALGMDPTQADAHSKDDFYVEDEGDLSYFVYEYERRTDYVEQGLSYTLILTPDLKTPSTEEPYDVTIGAAVEGYESVTTRYLIEDDAKFIQLEVEQVEE
jgi:hypothetical protein